MTLHRRCQPSCSCVGKFEAATFLCNVDAVGDIVGDVIVGLAFGAVVVGAADETGELVYDGRPARPLPRPRPRLSRLMPRRRRREFTPVGAAVGRLADACPASVSV